MVLHPAHRLSASAFAEASAGLVHARGGAPSALDRLLVVAPVATAERLEDIVRAAAVLWALPFHLNFGFAALGLFWSGDLE